MHGVITFYLRTIAPYQAVLPLTITNKAGVNFAFCMELAVPVTFHQQCPTTVGSDGN